MIEPTKQASIYMICPKPHILCESNHIYVGCTKRTLNQRFAEHKKDFRRRQIGHGYHCSSFELFETYGADNLHIVEIEKCDLSIKKQREKYWIKQIDGVNIRKLDFDNREFMREYYRINKEEIKERCRLAYHRRRQQQQQEPNGN